ncbi:ZIP family metal transporter [Halopiger aswanensis]|uniref:ZIP family zinc transporter n=1 Tax=Halopiger aswanensis TaxID=148449 RepID=A0A3R7HXA2_9EURY|nr:metal cation transporter [Halopiger aswanensis]RKD94766.1 ZIP family zinc transporter [Halopiger aswanensis]
MRERSNGALPQWLLAVGPVLVLGSILGLLSLTTPFEALVAVDDASTLEIVWLLTVIGALAGVVPVAIGMLWFPFIRDLDPRYLHGFLALAGGVLAFIAIQLTVDIVETGLAADRTGLAMGLAVVGIVGTFVAMHAVSAWRQRTMAAADTDANGLAIAYLVALALGLHSIGEGLGIGVSFVRGDTTQVTLLVLAFVTHNVMEGPTVVAAVARDRTAPPLRHFAAMGLLAGGPVILGGWLGSFANSAPLAVLFFAVAVGAIAQVLIEVAGLIRFDAEGVLTRTNVATFAVGFALMFFLEDVLAGALLNGVLVPS